MGTSNIIKLLNSKEIPLFTLNELGNLFGTENRQTLYKKVLRLEKIGILKKLIKGKYQFLLKEAGDFTIANFLYQPSYISMESALSFHSIMTGFPHQITSITIKKSKEFEVGGREYIYSTISPDLFWGWEKKENFLVATPEKALLDYLYFAKKGLRNFDWEEIDTSNINKDILFLWAKKFNIKINMSFRQKI